MPHWGIHFKRPRAETTYFYETIAPDGTIETGQLQSMSKKAARIALRKKNLHPYQIVKQSPFHVANQGVSLPLLESFCTSLAYFLKEGFPIAQALYAFQGTIIKAQRFKDIVCALAKHVAAGESFHQSLTRYRAIFDPFFIMMVATGEASGQLGSILLKLSHYIKWKEETKKALRQATLYPLFVLFLLSALITFLTIFLVPQLQKLYTMQKIPLSSSTKIFFAIQSCFTLEKGRYLLLTIMLGTGLFWYAHRHIKAFHLWTSSLVYRLPWVRYFIKERVHSLYFLTLSFMAEGHIPLHRALTFLQEQTTNPWLKNVYGEIATHFYATGDLTSTLTKSRFFPPLTLTFLANAEKNGTLLPTFQRLHHMHQDNFLTACTKLAEKMPHFLLITAGVIVLWLVTSLFLPLYQQALQGVLNIS